MGLIKETLINLFKKPITEKYPKEKRKPPARSRGMPKPIKGKCTACGLCEAYCPTEAIELFKDEKYVKIDLSKCSFCGLCVDICPVRAIKNKTKFEHATDDKKELIIK